MSQNNQIWPAPALLRHLAAFLPRSFQEGKLPYMFFFVSLMIVMLLVYS